MPLDKNVLSENKAKLVLARGHLDYVVSIPEDDSERVLNELGRLGPVQSFFYEGREVFGISAKQYQTLRDLNVKWQEIKLT